MGDLQDIKKTVRLFNILGMKIEIEQQASKLRFMWKGKSMSIWMPLSQAKAWTEGFLIGSGLKRQLKKD
jgi:hypothetical protein